MKKALLISLREDVDEIESLLKTLGFDIESRIVQKRNKPHSVAFLGPGKLDEVADEMSEDSYDVIVVNGILRPSQHHTLEMRFGKECIDRVGVILRIFAEHAHTEEAKKQVTLARMRYELPFLREWIHKAKAGERPGFLSGGAYATEVYYEHARSHVKKIEIDLESRSTHRELMRRRRRESGYMLISVAGYTNAGKSALLNALCGAAVEVDDKLFATLSTTTRRLSSSNRKILVTDTVGFISDLPANLVHAFKSTFEEVFLADLILLVVDVSEDTASMKEKAEVCLKEITSHSEQRPLIIVGTKTDLLSPRRFDEVQKTLASLTKGGEFVLVSSVDRRGFDDLIDAIESRSPRDCIVEAVLPIGDQANSLISQIHDIGDVSQSHITGSSIELHVACNVDDSERIIGQIRKIGGQVTHVSRPRASTGMDGRPKPVPLEEKGGP